MMSLPEKKRAPALLPRRLSIGLLCTLLFLCPPGFTRSGEAGAEKVRPRIWKVQDAVRFALGNNPDARTALRRIEAAAAVVASEKASFLPQLTAYSHYTLTNTPMYSFGNILNQGAFSEAIDFNNPGHTDSLSFAVRLGYAIFNGWRDQAGLSAAEAEGAAARLASAAVRSRLSFEVVRAFNQIVQAGELVRGREAAVADSEGILRVARAREQEGVLLRADLLALEVEHARRREELSRERHGLALARKVFLVLLGLEGEEVFLDEVEETPQEVPQEALSEQRPELQGAAELIRAAEERVRLAGAGHYPSVEGYAGYGVERGEVLDHTGDSWEAGVRLRYNLFDGQRTSAEVSRAVAVLAEAREQKRKLELAIGLEVEQARLALLDARERLRTTEESVALAQESVRIYRERFQEGLLLASDLIAAEKRLTEAVVRRAIARGAEKNGVADLRRALGLDQFPQGTGGAGQR